MPGTGRFDISVLGDKALEAKLRALPAAIEQRLLRKSLRAAFKPTLEKARELVPTELGALKASLQLRAGRGGRGTIQFRIFTGGLPELAALGARRTRPYTTTENRRGRIIAHGLGSRGAEREGYYPAAVELGYVRRTKTGAVHVPPRSFLRAALNATKDTSLMIVAEDLREGVEQLAKEGASS